MAEPERSAHFLFGGQRVPCLEVGLGEQVARFGVIRVRFQRILQDDQGAAGFAFLLVLPGFGSQFGGGLPFASGQGRGKDQGRGETGKRGFPVGMQSGLP
jgi:hypothetical protein